MLIPDAKATMEKKWKEVIKKTHKTKGKGSPLCCIDGHPPHPKVRVHPGECSREQSQVWKLSSPDEGAVHELREEIDEAGLRPKLVQSLTKVQSLNISECSVWILTRRGIWITVHHCAKRKRTSIICVSNLHSLPWNIPSKAHKIRTALKRRWIFKRASGNRCLHDAGKSRPSRKAAAAAAAAAAILCQHIRGQSPITEKKRVLQKRKEFGLLFLDDRRGEDIIWNAYLQECPLRHRCESGKTRSERSIHMPHFQY